MDETEEKRGVRAELIASLTKFRNEKDERLKKARRHEIKARVFHKIGNLEHAEAHEADADEHRTIIGRLSVVIDEMSADLKRFS